MDVKTELIKALTKVIDEPFTLETPPNPAFGDFALPCFKLKKKPPEILKVFKLPGFIAKAEQKGPYVNFFIKEEAVAKDVLKEILAKKDQYGAQALGKGKTLIVEFSSPNVGKPFGIGHLRSTIIGNALANIAEKAGYKVVRMNYLGDWGTQFGKLMVGFKRFGIEKELKKDPIRHLLEVYVKVNEQPDLEEEARAWFKKLEGGEKEAVALWKRFRELSVKESSAIYKRLRIKFDVVSGESFYNKAMQSVEAELVQKRLLVESEGAQVINLEAEGLGVCIVRKTNGSSSYFTRDVAAAIDRQKRYKFAQMWYEVGSEQKLHFRQLFTVLKKMGYSWAEHCAHVEHGLYLDKDGKKFSTRRGKTVFMKDILDETTQLARKVIEEKNPSLKKKDEVAQMVAAAAIFYGDLKNNRAHDMVFDLERFVDFEGDTGPYIQYTCARAASILRKAKTTKGSKVRTLNATEGKLVKILAQFPETIQTALQDRAPNVIAGYAFRVAQTFNEFYRDCPVLGQEPNVTAQRLVLVRAVQVVLKNSLALLSIEAPSSM